ncbi:HrpE/YscL family type III secretion apparatus protein [Bordetella genomosp. 9]|nr:HrpE/YscL family type III secretion apparatus protein [Bordetella genomosp. 9]
MSFLLDRGGMAAAPHNAVNEDRRDREEAFTESVDRHAGRPDTDGHAGLAVRPLGKVLRAESYARVVDAAEVLRHARSRAARILKDAKSAFHAERARGYALGKEEARAELAAEMVSMSRRMRLQIEGMESGLGEIVVAAMRKIIADFDDRQRALAAVRSGLALMRQQNHVTLRVNTDVAAALREDIDGLRKAFPKVGDIEIVEDERLGRDVCRLESAIGTVDVSLEAQLETLRRVLENALSRGGLATPENEGSERDV